MHIVFDFDCTLTANHWWKTLHQFWIPNNKVRTYYWDSYSKNVLQDGCLTDLDKATDLLHYIWCSNKDGEQVNIDRYYAIFNLLNSLRDHTLHISTNGSALETLAMLEASGMNKLFTSIHGYTPKRTHKVVLDNAGNTIKQYTDDNSKTIFMIEFGEEVLYIDDSRIEESNLLDNDTITAYYIEKENGGLQDKHYKTILEILEMLKSTEKLF